MATEEKFIINFSDKGAEATAGKIDKVAKSTDKAAVATDKLDKVQEKEKKTTKSVNDEKKKSVSVFSNYAKELKKTSSIAEVMTLKHENLTLSAKKVKSEYRKITKATKTKADSTVKLTTSIKSQVTAMKSLSAAVRTANTSGISQSRALKEQVTLMKGLVSTLKETNKAMQKVGSSTKTTSTNIKKVTANVQKTTKKLKPMNKELKETNGLMGRMKGAIAGVIAAFGAGTLLNLSDQWVVLNNKIRLVDKSMKDQLSARKALVKSSKVTNSELEATVDLYKRTGRAMKAYGVSQRANLLVTEAVSKTLKLSGATTQEATSAMLQFGQALTSNKLGGDEFRSLTENAGELITAIRTGLGVTSAELLKMKTAGELTATKVFGAILKQIPQINKNFEKVNRTSKDWMTYLKNSLLVVVGETSEWMKTSTLVGNIIKPIADNMKSIAKLVAVIAGIGGLVLIHKLTLAISVGVWKMKKAMVGFALSAKTSLFYMRLMSTTTIIALVAGFISLYKHSELFRYNIDNAGKNVKKLLDSIGGYLPIMKTIVDFFSGLNFDGIVIALQTAIVTTIEWIKLIPQIWEPLGGAFSNLLHNLQIGIANLFKSIIDGVSLVGKSIKDLNFDNLWEKFQKGYDNSTQVGVYKDVMEPMKGIIGKAENVYDKVLASNIKLAKTQKQEIANQKELVRLAKEKAAAEQATALAFETHSLASAARLKDNKGNDAFVPLKGITQDVSFRTPIEQSILNIPQLQSDVEQATTILDEFKLTGESMWVGINLGFEEFSNNTLTMMDFMSTATQKVFKGMTDAIMQFAQTGKVSWRSLASTIIAELLRIQIQALLTKAITGIANIGAGMFGGGGGSVGGGADYSFGTGSPSTGGFKLDTPSLDTGYKFGGGPSYSPPTPSVDIGSQGGGGQAPVIVNNYIGNEQIAEAMNTPAGQKVIENYMLDR